MLDCLSIIFKTGEIVILSLRDVTQSIVLIVVNKLDGRQLKIGPNIKIRVKTSKIYNFEIKAK